MKKLLSLLLAIVMMLSFAACGDTSGVKPGSLTASVLPSEDLNTLNAISNAGFGFVGNQIMENVFAQELENSKGERFIAVVKVTDEQYDEFEAIDFWDEEATQKYLGLIGDNPVEDILAASDFLPDKDQLAVYKGVTIAEFEAEGAWMSGYSGADGKYSFDFSDDFCDYRVELEKGTKLEDFDDMDMFEAAIQDMKIGSVECIGLSSMFVQNYLSQFLDAPEPVIPQEMGEAKASLAEINEAVGSDIKAIPGAADEKFNVIGDKIAQYICVVDGIYYCVRSSADTAIDLADDIYSEDPIVDQEGYVTISSSHTDAIDSVRFVFNDYQYAYIIYDNGEFDWNQISELQSAYRESVCEYPDGSAFAGLMGTYTAEDNYSMSLIPISSESAQATIFTYNETEQKLWSMIVKVSGSKLTYSKSRLEVYKNGSSSVQDAGKGSITVKEGSLIWDNHTFKK